MTDAELFQRVVRLQTLLELLPKKLWWMKVDLDRLYGSGRVASLGGKVAHAYLWLLGRMWDRGGYIPADDRIIAGALMIDVATWRRTYKPYIEPMLQRLHDGSIGDIFSQKTLIDIMLEQAEKAMANKAKTGAASSARRKANPAKPTHGPLDTSTVTVGHDGDRHDDVTISAPDTVTVHPLAPAYRVGPGEQAPQPSAAGPPHAFTAVPLRSGDLGNVAPPSDPALVKRLVSDGLKRRATGLMAALEPREEDDDGQP